MSMRTKQQLAYKLVKKKVNMNIQINQADIKYEQTDN